MSTFNASQLAQAFVAEQQKWTDKGKPFMGRLPQNGLAYSRRAICHDENFAPRHGLPRERIDEELKGVEPNNHARVYRKMGGSIWKNADHHKKDRIRNELDQVRSAAKNLLKNAMPEGGAKS